MEDLQMDVLSWKIQKKNTVMDDSGVPHLRKPPNDLT